MRASTAGISTRFATTLPQVMRTTQVGDELLPFTSVFAKLARLCRCAMRREFQYSSACLVLRVEAYPMYYSVEDDFTKELPGIPHFEHERTD